MTTHQVQRIEAVNCVFATTKAARGKDRYVGVASRPRRLAATGPLSRQATRWPKLPADAPPLVQLDCRYREGISPSAAAATLEPLIQLSIIFFGWPNSPRSASFFPKLVVVENVQNLFSAQSHRLFQNK
jgi:hypothetical protein